MRSLPLSEAKDQLSGLVAEAEATHEIITITKHGRPAAVLMAAADLESLHETLFWLSREGIASSVDSAEQDLASGATTSAPELRAAFGLPER